MATSDRRVVIVGGGFGGLNAAKTLGNKKGIQVTIVDKRNYHIFQPLLYQVAMADLNPSDICTPIRQILSKYRNIEVLCDEVYQVDTAGKSIKLRKNKDLEFDYLVLACGSSVQYFSNDHWAEFAPGLKSVENALTIRQRVLESYEKASVCQDEEEKRRLLTFVVIGGGPTGVELAGALGEMAQVSLVKDYPTISRDTPKVILVEGADRIFLAYPENLARKAHRDLEKFGVDIWTNCMVTDINAETIKIGEKQVPSQNCIWAAGVGASPLNKLVANAPLDRIGRLKVDSCCRLEGSKSVFVVGDQACYEDQDKPLPALAPVAIQQGKYVGKSIVATIRGKSPSQFSYFDKGHMAIIGRNKAILKVGFLKISGFVPWLAWLFVHVAFLEGAQNRLSVLLSWLNAYITRRKSSRIIYQSLNLD